MTHSPAILALFTSARRKHLGLSQPRLARRLKITPASLRACESARRFAKSAEAALLKFNELEAENG